MRLAPISKETIAEFEELKAYNVKMYDIKRQSLKENDVLMINRCDLELRSNTQDLIELLQYLIYE
jgi:hypothetical protein